MTYGGTRLISPSTKPSCIEGDGGTANISPGGGTGCIEGDGGTAI